MTAWSITFIKNWKAHGINCGLAVGHMGALCGYIQVPHNLREIYSAEEKTGLLNIHGGITYEIDNDGWIGFDTCHADDLWSMKDRKKYNDIAGRKELRLAMTIAPSLSQMYCEGPRIWTMKKITEETERLAEQIKR